MNSDWPRAELSKLTTSKRPITYGVVKPGPLDDNGVLFIRGGDIADGHIVTGQLRTISNVVSNQYRRTLLVGGELLVSLVGNPGQVAIVPAELSGANIARQVGLVCLRDDVDTRFIKYYLSSAQGQYALKGQSLGSVQQVINLRDLKTIEVPVPPLPEQRAIAHVLGTLDDKIELNRRINETLEELARAIFKSWFVDFDPVKAKADGRQPVGMDSETAALFPDSFEDSELGPVPAGWTVGKLGQIATQRREQVLPEEVIPGEPYIGLDDMPRRHIGLSSWKVDEEIASAKFRFDREDILFGKLRPYFHKVGIAPVAGVCSTDIVVIRSTERHLFGYVLGTVSSDAFVAYTDSVSTGTRMPRVSWNDMSAWLAALPPNELQMALNNATKPLYHLLVSNIEESRTLAELRDTLLPRLISGQLRIPDAEKLLAEAPV